MIETKITKEYLDIFLKDLRYQDKLELEKFSSNEFLDNFYQICLDEKYETYFLTVDNKPLALGGAYEIFNKKFKTAKVWLLTTNQLEGNKLKFYKYVKNKISEFKRKYDVLFNFIYESNFDSLNLLEANDFIVVELNNPSFKLFYFSKGEFNFDIRYFAC